MSDNPEPSVTGHNMIYCSDRAINKVEEMSDIQELSVTGHNMIYYSDETNDNIRNCLTSQRLKSQAMQGWLQWWGYNTEMSDIPESQVLDHAMMTTVTRLMLHLCE